MSRQPVMAGYLAQRHHLSQLQSHPSHYGAPAQGHYEPVGHSGLAFARPLPMRAPVHPPAGFDHQHTGHHHQHGRTPFAMADPAYMPSDDEMAHLQKLSSEFQPETAVSSPPVMMRACR